MIPTHYTYFIWIFDQTDILFEIAQFSYHLCIQTCVEAVAELQDDNKGYYSLHTAGRCLWLFFSLAFFFLGFS